MDLVLLIGLQGSGKSTFCRARLAATHHVVSMELFPNNRRPRRRQLQLTAEALAAGQSVVLDNTNASVAERAPLLDLGRTHGARTIGYYFATSLEECLRRNAGRQGRQRVPDIALYATRKRLELPSRREGFDQLYAVEVVEDADWLVSGWEEDTGNETT
jgi:predicted kinase